jgi:CBS domain-containing protein
MIPSFQFICSARRQAMKVKDLMTPGPETVGSGDPVKKAAELMEKNNVGVVPVFDEGGGAIGVLTDRDIALRLVAEGKDPQTTKTGDIMSRGVVYCPDDAHASKAAQIMEEKKVRRLLVRDSRGKITGIVSLGDLAQSLSKDKAGKLIREVSRSVAPAG